MTARPVPDTDPALLEEILAGLAASAAPLADTDRLARARAVRAVADALDAASADLVEVAARETWLPLPRLTGEVGRTSGQLRMFAGGLEEGSYLDVIIDPADPGATPVPRPDLRRVQVPLGPVLVFAGSNFPFAFSVAGGDTASALAAGCPVVVKAHPGHPETSVRTAEVVRRAWEGAGMPAGSFALVLGEQVGVDALRDPRITAAGFTGSLHGGTALYRIAAQRDAPIPFYAEMGSLNPTFVTAGAIAARGDEIAAGFVTSFTLGVGQFCTKPGLLFLPRGHGLDAALERAVAAAAPGRMLHERIRTGHDAVRAQLAALPGMRVAAAVDSDPDAGGPAGATLLATDLATLLAEQDTVLPECFGPTSVVVEYDGMDDVLVAARAFGASLTATVHAEPDEIELVRPLVRELRDQAGRIVWNGWPTGVAVSWAMHHGGPWPATSSPLHTSVGMTAIRRFLRPVTYQDVPAALLDDVLQDANPAGIPRRLGGRLSTGDLSRS
ncbi:aldehyde dehydrogenase (NADP(+)) [Blastococcus haudaquaticus]|uniref:NADP-dependent aldehyde dehydrogenase n=1 Tax=Blastococcus haudaquaticus TaxID=1938745 RepID=A0A286H7R4_9ACTN|nr:aldehyde dehydrogenase (NADP(+)) [Blastococcus haudaquaticus]SOE03833.1 NADP-dependent aldehyde dehydrogenase [Blastococcus haudaquaticus]